MLKPGALSLRGRSEKAPHRTLITNTAIIAKLHKHERKPYVKRRNLSQSDVESCHKSVPFTNSHEQRQEEHGAVTITLRTLILKPLYATFSKKAASNFLFLMQTL
jgi:hypothetical protein